MLTELEKNEADIATKLIFDGLSMAKLSMEQILQSPISIKKIDYGDDDNKVPRFLPENDDLVHLISTTLMGELKGTSYLIFSEGEVNKICKACLPAGVLENDTPEGKMMKMGFLTEIDNMVSAAVITEFSNFLGLDIFGHVPSLQVIKASAVNGFLEEETTEFDSVIHFKANFHGAELDVSPDFVWIFQKEFVEKIKQVA
ncbi:MAG: hypothetical protein KI790_12600 [Cyclobacteriaceae bacterium]|nr:hypothetical protein [Cyclobacteriaceae bacterium HetDA_MAG_MS6]